MMVRTAIAAALIGASHGASATVAIVVPEGSTLSLLAGGVVAAIVAVRLFRRK